MGGGAWRLGGGEIGGGAIMNWVSGAILSWAGGADLAPGVGKGGRGGTEGRGDWVMDFFNQFLIKPAAGENKPRIV